MSRIPSTTSLDSNEKTLLATRKIQNQTLQALERIQRQAAETQAVGGATLEQLEEQDRRMDTTLEATQTLNSHLKHASKLQDRFAMWSLQLNTKSKARQQVRKAKEYFHHTAAEEAKSDVIVPKFKRLGPRPKKNIVPDEDEAFAWSSTTTGSSAMKTTTPNEAKKLVAPSTTRSSSIQEIQTQVDRAELFAGSQEKKNTTTGTTSRSKPHRVRDYSSRPGGGASNNRHHPKNGSSKHHVDDVVVPPPLTEYEKDMLAEIHAEDQAVDIGLDALSTQIESLLHMSKTMGEMTSQNHHKKLIEIDNNMNKADHKSQKLNQRVKLFAMNRRQKQKEDSKFDTP